MLINGRVRVRSPAQTQRNNQRLISGVIAKFKSGAILQQDRTAELGADASAYACFSPILLKNSA